MNILVIGYGKIGRIKSFIWKSLGADVFVFDTNTQLHDKIINDGFTVWKTGNALFSGTVDISTPAGKHYEALKWCTSQAKINAEIILVEKPLASTREELQAILDLLKSSLMKRDRLYVNESYYQSAALQFVANDIKVKQADITAINIELSKNRLNDHDSGRFFDMSLDAIGIEVPHMIAILDMLNIDLDAVRQSSPILYIDKERQDNQAVLLRNCKSFPQVQLSSFLGSFRENVALPKNDPSIIRNATIRTNVDDYSIAFDPAPDCPRYYSRLSIYRNNSLVADKIVSDDHLKNHLQLFMGNSYAEHISSIGFQKAAKITEMLIELREKSSTQFINPPAINSKSLDKEKELINGTRI